MTAPAVPLSPDGQWLLHQILLWADTKTVSADQWAQLVADTERDARSRVGVAPLPRGDRYVLYWPDWRPARATEIRRQMEAMHPGASFTVLPAEARLERWPERRISPARLAAARSRGR